MAKAKRKTRRAISADEMQREAVRRAQSSLEAKAHQIGVPEEQIADMVETDIKIREAGKVVTLTTLRRLYPNIADRWLAQGGPGFEEPERRAIEHCRSLWVRAATEGRLVANLDRAPGGSSGDGWSQHEALAELGTFKDRLPHHVWDVFENVVRWDEPAGVAGSKFAANSPQAIAHAKASVGFVLSMVAQWRKF